MFCSPHKGIITGPQPLLSYWLCRFFRNPCQR